LVAGGRKDARSETETGATRYAIMQKASLMKTRQKPAGRAQGEWRPRAPRRKKMASKSARESKSSQKLGHLANQRTF
jgi:hypothetical protein